MEYIALEECRGIPELAARRSDALSGIRLRRSYMSEVHSRLNDFTEYRLPEMDEYSIAVQVLSWVTPGTYREERGAVRYGHTSYGHAKAATESVRPNPLP
jgi:2,3-dihydroxybenzoate decarboxylase